MTGTRTKTLPTRPRKLHVKLTEAEFKSLANLARKRSVTMSEVIREYLAAQVAR
jgi:hypothetical protein